MNIVNSGSMYQVYGDDVKTYKVLPAATYEINFGKLTGFFLTVHPDLEVNEEKVYGNHEARAEKVLRSFDNMNRNLGIILSGQKGIGKSLFARVLAKAALKRGLPVLIAQRYIPGIASFISSIEQEVVVIFDEFEKTFRETEEASPQEEMLSLFDGIDNGRKIFVITCNETRSLSSFLLNRPGRFHYHFCMSNPNAEEVAQYLCDKLKPEYHDNIDRIVRLSNTINITYDYLRAIVFELNQGYSLEETMNDLNITRGDSVSFDITLHMLDGSTFVAYDETIDMFSGREKGFWARNVNTSMRRFFFINLSAIVNEGGRVSLSGEHIRANIDETDFYEIEDKEVRERAVAEERNKLTVRYATFERCPMYSMDRFTI